VPAQFGRVHNYLDTADSPEAPEEVVEVHARTSHGDIVIRRARIPGLCSCAGGEVTASTPARLAIPATGLRKSFGDQVVLDGIDPAVAEETIFSLLSPNGADKPDIGL